jgi:hypothetical protein
MQSNLKGSSNNNNFLKNAHGTVDYYESKYPTIVNQKSQPKLIEKQSPNYPKKQIGAIRLDPLNNPTSGGRGDFAASSFDVSNMPKFSKGKNYIFL